MKRKDYQKPTIYVVKLQHTGMLMTSGERDVKATMITRPRKLSITRLRTLSQSGTAVRRKMPSACWPLPPLSKHLFFPALLHLPLSVKQLQSPAPHFSYTSFSTFPTPHSPFPNTSLFTPPVSTPLSPP